MESQQSRKFTDSITLDFDGVIHPYNLPFDPISAPEPPTKGTREAIQALLDLGYEVYVFSTRCESDHGVELIRDYCRRYDLPVTDVVRTKERSKVYVDDRAYRFEGDWKTFLDWVGDKNNILPHNKKKKKS